MRNNITNSGCGTSIYGSNRNIISNNNYVDNTFQFSANEDYYLTWGGNLSINTINGNYWSDYNGTDVNGDGIGDTPYFIDENNQDNQPLINPANSLPPPFQSTRPSPSTPTTSPTPTLSPSTSPSNSPTQQPTLEPSPTADGRQTEDFAPTIIIIGLVAIAVAIGLLVYFRKKKG